MSICTTDTATAKSQVVVGRNRCTWGPSYWCASLSNLRECNSTDYCSKQIWSQQTIKKKENDPICQYCERRIVELSSLIRDNKIDVS